MDDSIEQNDLPEVHSRPPTLRVRNWPLVDELRLTIIMLTLITTAAAITAIVSHNFYVVVLSVSALFVTSWRAWLPVTFELGPAGVTEELFRRRLVPWAQFHRYEFRNGGVYLYRDEDSTPISRIKGMYIQLGDRQSEAYPILQRYLRNSFKKRENGIAS